jgi:hypothetical protein
MRSKPAIEEIYREQLETVQNTLERTITQMERSTATLNELAKVEEGRIVEIRQFYETLRKALSKLCSDQGDQLKALTRANVNDILAEFRRCGPTSSPRLKYCGGIGEAVLSLAMPGARTANAHRERNQGAANASVRIGPPAPQGVPTPVEPVSSAGTATMRPGATFPMEVSRTGTRTIRNEHWLK